MSVDGKNTSSSGDGVSRPPAASPSPRRPWRFPDSPVTAATTSSGAAFEASHRTLRFASPRRSVVAEAAAVVAQRRPLLQPRRDPAVVAGHQLDAGQRAAVRPAALPGPAQREDVARHRAARVLHQPRVALARPAGAAAASSTSTLATAASPSSRRTLCFQDSPRAAATSTSSTVTAASPSHRRTQRFQSSPRRTEAATASAASLNQELASVKQKKALGIRYCCVVDCHSRYGDEGIELYTFPTRKNPVQAEKWRRAVKRRNPDGSAWKESLNTRICSMHFISGRFSWNKCDPDYVPSVFPTSYHARAKSHSDQARHERVRHMT